MLNFQYIPFIIPDELEENIEFKFKLRMFNSYLNIQSIILYTQSIILYTQPMILIYSSYLNKFALQKNPFELSFTSYKVQNVLNGI